MDELKRALAEWLAQQRQIKGLTQTELARELDRPQSYISKIENLEKNLDFLEFIHICRYLDVDPTDLVSKLFRSSH